MANIYINSRRLSKIGTRKDVKCGVYETEARK